VQPAQKLPRRGDVGLLDARSCLRPLTVQLEVVGGADQAVSTVIGAATLGVSGCPRGDELGRAAGPALAPIPATHGFPYIDRACACIRTAMVTLG